MGGRGELSRRESPDGAHDIPSVSRTPDERAVRPGRPRVLVIDGNLLTAEAIAVALGALTFAARFVDPATASHLRELIMTWRPDLALLDIEAIGRSASLACVGILGGAGIPVAILSGGADDGLLGECVHTGASSVVDKRAPLTEMVGVIARLLEGEKGLGEAARQRMIEPHHRDCRARHARLAPFESLTRRERCVLADLMEGQCAAVIAERSSVSIATVRSQIKAILRKLGVNSQLAAAALARQTGWSLDDSTRYEAATRL